MWRRVPCEQPLHKAQSILSPRQTAMLYAVVRVFKLSSLRMIVTATDERGRGPHSATWTRNRSHVSWPSFVCLNWFTVKASSG